MISNQVVIETKVVNPNDRCPDVQFEITPEVSDVGTVYTLHLFGEFYIPVDRYNGWTWQTADKFESPGVINTSPTWSNADFGQLTYIQTQPNKLVRVYFNIGDCEYYSNISGFEKVQTPISTTNTNSVILNVSGTDDHTLEADVRISSEPDNILTILPDGLFVNPAPSIGTDITIDFTPEISTGPPATFDTSVYFSSCSGTPTYAFQWVDPNIFYGTTINASTGVLTYQFTPYYYGGISNNCVVVQRTCNGVIDIVRFNYVIDFSLVQALNTYFEEGNRTPSSYSLTINSVTPQYLQFTSSTVNANMFTNISGNTLLRYDGIAGNTNLAGIVFEVHLSGNVSVPDDEDFTIRLVQNGTPSTDKLMVNSWRTKHSFSKHYIITLNPTDTIGFDVLHSNLISPGNIITTFSDVCILLKPIGYAV